jgi:nucleotide-binding universal stress UspA family protein
MRGFELGIDTLPNHSKPMPILLATAFAFLDPDQAPERNRASNCKCGVHTRSGEHRFVRLRSDSAPSLSILPNPREHPMFKSILVPYVNSLTETNVLESALAIAADCTADTSSQKTAAHLAILVGIEIPVMLPDVWAPSADGLVLCDAAHAHAKAVSERLAQRTKNAVVVPEIRVLHTMGDSASQMAALHARYADICLVPTATGADSGLAHHYFSALLMHSGRPVLAVPEHCPATASPKHVVIAWQPTRETTRAVHDAMPFLRAAQTVDVLMIDPEVGDTAHGENPGADIATHLARHSLRVNVVCVPSSGRGVAHAINEYVSQVGATLLVAGGYGHNRLKEFLLGGVTRALLQTAVVPVLFSH